MTPEQIDRGLESDDPREIRRAELALIDLAASEEPVDQQLCRGAYDAHFGPDTRRTVADNARTNIGAGTILDQTAEYLTIREEFFDTIALSEARAPKSPRGARTLFWSELLDRVLAKRREIRALRRLNRLVSGKHIRHRLGLH